jgi:hypothetical protein
MILKDKKCYIQQQKDVEKKMYGRISYMVTHACVKEKKTIHVRL